MPAKVSAALDMMLDWIGRHHGAALAAAVSEQFIHERIRNAGDSQRLALSVRLGTSDPRLLAIVKAMEAHIDEPLPIATLAASAGINRRQIERLFEAHMGHGPAAHYRRLRLERARALAQSTDMAMIEIAHCSPELWKKMFTRLAMMIPNRPTPMKAPTGERSLRVV